MTVPRTSTLASYSTAGFKDRPIEAGLDAIAAAGFRCIELGGCGSSIESWACPGPQDAPPAPTGRAVEAFSRAAAQRGLNVTTIHAPMQRNCLGAPDQAWRRQKVEVLGQYLHFAGQMGAAGVVVHGVPNAIFLPKGADVPALVSLMPDAMKRSLDELAPVAADAGVRILLENLPYVNDVPPRPYPLVNMSQLRPFVADYDPDQVGLIVDTGHAWTNGQEPVDEIQTAGDRLWGTHIQDVPRDNPNDNHWAPTQGGLDWQAIRNALQSVNYGGAWTFEVIQGPEDQTPDELAQITRAVATQWGLE